MAAILITGKIRSKLGEDIPILLVSAYDWSEIEEEARAAGVNGFISKPLLTRYLLKAGIEVMKE